MIRFLAVCLALALPAAAAAHSFWLEPRVHTLDADDDMRVAFKVGDIGEEASDWGLFWERIASLRLYGPIGVTDQQGAVRTTGAGEPGGAVISIAQPGTHILAFESNPSFSDLEAERFNRYLDHQGLSAIQADRAAKGTQGANGTELYARRAKALFQVGDNPTGNVTKPVGQTLEIVPLANPFDLEKGDTLAVQVLWRGKPLEGASLTVVRPYAKTDKEVVLQTDGEGKAEFELQFGSRYLLSVVWGEPAPNDSRADYFTIFSSLTFPSV